MLVRVRNPDDDEAWSQFLEIYAPIVRAYCLQRRIQNADAEDVVQEVMSGVATSIRAFDYDPRKGRFRAWLGTVAANKIKSFLAKVERSIKPTGESHLLPQADAYADPDAEWVAIFSDRVFRIACRRVRGDVEETTWQCFELCWVKDEPAAQVAALLKIPIHSVYVNKSRVLKKLEAEVRSLSEDLPFPDRP